MYSFDYQRPADRAAAVAAMQGDARFLAGGQSLIAFALAHLPASFGSVALLTQPVVAAILAVVILGEVPVIWQALGGAVVLLGIYLAKRGTPSA